MGEVPTLLPISSVSGHNEGWISPSLVVQVGCNPGQRTIQWRDGDRIRLSQRAFDYPDELFMRALGLGAQP